MLRLRKQGVNMKKNVKAHAKKMSLRKEAPKPTYEKDFFAWTEKQVQLLKNKDFEKLDIENLVEEIETLGRSEKRVIKSHLINLLMHMLKINYQTTHQSKSLFLSN